jgi:hypothetical protein
MFDIETMFYGKYWKFYALLRVYVFSVNAFENAALALLGVKLQCNIVP